jgi:hypothetical protein
MPTCNGRVIRSEDAERFCQAFTRTLKSLNLVDRGDPLCDFIARRIIEIDAAGVHDPKEIAKIAVRQLNNQDRENLDKRAGAPNEVERNSRPRRSVDLLFLGRHD